ncbi:Hypothetical_protein [Hexamita inflata]|uniref:Hypothetical_protein n=1 Tax=Hexamita inflata TaxID=28002 RepID=A0AA86P6I3_9EUKA|nr:Hypothetical protein HINF_LOCUS20248 [Hexamita inflata]
MVFIFVSNLSVLLPHLCNSFNVFTMCDLTSFKIKQLFQSVIFDLIDKTKLKLYCVFINQKFNNIFVQLRYLIFVQFFPFIKQVIEKARSHGFKILHNLVLKGVAFSLTRGQLHVQPPYKRKCDPLLSEVMQQGLLLIYYILQFGYLPVCHSLSHLQYYIIVIYIDLLLFPAQNLEALRVAADTLVPRFIPAIPKIVTKITSEVNNGMILRLV